MRSLARAGSGRQMWSGYGRRYLQLRGIESEAWCWVMGHRGTLTGLTHSWYMAAGTGGALSSLFCLGLIQMYWLWQCWNYIWKNQLAFISVPGENEGRWWLEKYWCCENQTACLKRRLGPWDRELAQSFSHHPVAWCVWFRSGHSEPQRKEGLVWGQAAD